MIDVPQDPSRREFLKKIPIAVVTIAGGGIAGALYKSTEGLIESFERDTIRIFKPSEQFRNITNSLALSFSELSKNEILFYGDEGEFVGSFSFPKNWLLMNEVERQKWRDERRKELAQKYDLDTYSESDLIASSRRAQLLGKNSWASRYIDLITGKTESYGDNKVLSDEKGRSFKQLLEESFGDFCDDPEVNTLMKDHIGALASIESNFDEDKVSPVGAIGILQLMPDTIKNPKINPRLQESTKTKETEKTQKDSGKGKKPDGVKDEVQKVKEDINLQITVSRNLFRDDWENHISKMGKEIQKRFFQDNPQDVKKYFLFPLLLNSYNTGITNIRKVMSAFLDQFPNKQSLEEHYKCAYDDGFGYDLFVLFTRFGRENKGAPTYGKDSSEYVLKIMAMKEALDHKKAGKPVEPLPYVKKTERKQREEDWAFPEDFGQEIGKGALIGGLTPALAMLIWRYRDIILSLLRHRKGGGEGGNTGEEIPGIVGHNIRMNRRKLLGILVGVGVGVGAIGGVGIMAKKGYDYFKNNTEEEKITGDFAPSSRGLPPSLEKSIFGKARQLNTVSLPRKNHARTITPFLREMSAKLGITPAQTEKDLANLSGKLDINYSKNLDYRTSGFGEHIRKDKLTESEHQKKLALYYNIHPSTERLIREIGNELNEELRKKCGMDIGKHKVRLIVTSGSRDKEYAKKYLPNSSPDSSHPYGIAFDLSFTFDILDLLGKKSYTVGTDSPIQKIVFNTLGDIILKKQNKDGKDYNGKLFSLIEGRPPHIHITDKLGETWIPPYYREQQSDE